ncbi:MAG: MerR family transcriptional regulator [Bacteroidota bacterium]
MKQYSVKKVSKISGVSVRTLHYYDEIGLLKPLVRSASNYRFYGEKELLRLQQILFYRELDFPLKEIAKILDAPDFNLIQALEHHKKALMNKQDRLSTLLNTIDKTIVKLKDNVMLTPEELYEGMPKEKAEAYRNEAMGKWKNEVEKSENHLRNMSKSSLDQLKKDFDKLWRKLATMTKEDPSSQHVQKEIAQHYAFIRQFWGTVHDKDNQAEAYAGLGELYESDSRYTEIDGKARPDFGSFMSKAMKHFSETVLK